MSESEPEPGRESATSGRAWLIAASVLVPLIAVMELGGIQRVARALPCPRRDVFAYHYYQVAQAWDEREGKEVFILGSSMAIRGLDATAMQRSVNEKQGAERAKVVQLGLWENKERDKYLQTLQLLDRRPTVVVYTVSCNDMLGKELDDQEYFVSSTNSGPLYQALEKAQPANVWIKNAFYGTTLGRFRYLVGWRLRQLTKELPAAARMTASQRAAYFRHEIPPYPGEHAAPDEFSDWLVSRRRIYASDSFTTEGPSRVFAELAVRAWRNSGARVLVLNMPVYPELMEAYRAGTYESYLEFWQTVTRKYGCEFLDAHRAGLFETNEFFNSVHLNVRGQDRLTEMAAEKVAKLLTESDSS